MERIDLFDKYIQDRLTASEKAEFDARLESDEKFASDFKVYLLTIRGIQKEARQDNMDFGIAMKKLSKQQLREIIGKKADAPTMTKPKAIRFKPWIWQAASIAAVVVIAFTAVFNIERNCRYDIDNTIYACADITPDLARSGGEAIDITKLDDSQLKEKLPEIKAIYNTSETDDEIADNGYALAMAYVRLHDRDNAKVVLNELVTRFNGNPDYADSVNKWKSILKILK